MTIFLDSRASQNASYGNSLSIPIPTAGVLQLVAQQTLNLSAGTSGLIRVEFSGVVTFQQPTTPADTMVSIYVVRGASAAAGVNVFSLNQAIQAAEVGPRAISSRAPIPGRRRARRRPTACTSPLRLRAF
ncbi:hypothetical protein [Paenibacillus sp. P22]|uniref:hypothetical protein n=1 Tax=Paenibacillus sp. P22 TaxID=483908 RepID=UPI0003FAA5C4|nr:hypothetical protein [Paenibacillus sp. P22]